jgi:beta-glucosidase
MGRSCPDGQPAPDVIVSATPDPALIGEAVALAQEADLVVAVVGDTIGLIGETRSTATLALFGGQIELLDRLAATGKPMVVVVISSKPQGLPPSAIGAAALVQAFNPGMRGGRAIAELLIGLIEPSGRLPLTIPRHVGQQPVYYNQIRGRHGDRYADLTQAPQFAFGEDSHTPTPPIRTCRIHTPKVGPAQDIRATVTLTNTGHRPARETVQVYIRDLITSTTWADKELKAHEVELQPDTSIAVDLVVPASSDTLVTADERRLVESGSFDLLVGPSSRDRDLLAARFTIA